MSSILEHASENISGMQIQAAYVLIDNRLSYKCILAQTTTNRVVNTKNTNTLH